jgi:hypothetical protein
MARRRGSGCPLRAVRTLTPLEKRLWNTRARKSPIENAWHLNPLDAATGSAAPGLVVYFAALLTTRPAHLAECRVTAAR